MSPDEVRRFLTELPARTGKLATVRADGRPHVAPVWYVMDEDGSLVFSTGSQSIKGKNLARSRFATVCVDDEHPPFAFVIIEGNIELSTELDDLLPWTSLIAGRYMGEQQSSAFGERNAVPGELLVKLIPTRVTGVTGVAD